MCAIDIGTTYTSYALSYRNEYAANPLNIHCRQWTSSHGQWEKTPTVALFDSSMILLSFGFDALEEYASLGEKGRKECYLFTSIKAQIYNTKVISLF